MTSSTVSKACRIIAYHRLFSNASCLHDCFFICSVNLFFCVWSCHLPRGSSMALVPTDVAVWWRWRSAECKVSFASCMLQQDQQCCVHSASTAITKLLRARSNRQKLCRSEQAADSKHAQTGARRRARLGAFPQRGCVEDGKTGRREDGKMGRREDGKTGRR